MKRINIDEYQEYMGTLINIEDEKTYNTNHIDGSINIPYEHLLYNKDKLLSKDKKYYIYCNGGYKSYMATNLLNAYGYDVTQVLLKKS